MKKLFIIAILAAALAAGTSRAQIPQQFANFVFTNSAVDVAGFRGLTGDKYLAAFTYVKQITTTNDIANAGVMLTYDRAFTPHNIIAQQADMLTGGFTLSTSLYPLQRWIPTSTFRLDIGGYDEAGTATSGPDNGEAVNVLGGYVDWAYKSVEIGFLYQNRVENDYYRGNWFGAHLGWRF